MQMIAHVADDPQHAFLRLASTGISRLQVKATQPKQADKGGVQRQKFPIGIPPQDMPVAVLKRLGHDLHVVCLEHGVTPFQPERGDIITGSPPDEMKPEDRPRRFRIGGIPVRFVGREDDRATGLEMVMASADVYDSLAGQAEDQDVLWPAVRPLDIVPPDAIKSAKVGDT
jgi:hypothetical protein